MTLRSVRTACRRAHEVRWLALAGVAASFALAWAGWPAVSPAASAASPSAHVEITGALHAALTLDHADCGVIDKPFYTFEAESPSLRSTDANALGHYVFFLYADTTHGQGGMSLDTPTKAWHAPRQHWTQAKSVEFGRGGNSGSLNAALVPIPKETVGYKRGTTGTVRIVASWSAGACSKKLPTTA